MRKEVPSRHRLWYILKIHCRRIDVFSCLQSILRGCGGWVMGPFLDFIRNLNGQKASNAVKRLQEELTQNHQVLADFQADLHEAVAQFVEAQRARRLTALPIEELKEFGAINVRWSVLRNAGYRTIYDVQRVRSETLLRIRGVGEQTARRVIDAAVAMARHVERIPVSAPDVNLTEPSSAKVAERALRLLEARQALLEPIDQIADKVNAVAEQLREYKSRTRFRNLVTLSSKKRKETYEYSSNKATEIETQAELLMQSESFALAHATRERLKLDRNSPLARNDLASRFKARYTDCCACFAESISPFSNQQIVPPVARGIQDETGHSPDKSIAREIVLTSSNDSKPLAIPIPPHNAFTPPSVSSGIPGGTIRIPDKSVMCEFTTTSPTESKSTAIPIPPRDTFTLPSVAHDIQNGSNGNDVPSEATIAEFTVTPSSESKSMTIPIPSRDTLIQARPLEPKLAATHPAGSRSSVEPMKDLSQPVAERASLRAEIESSLTLDTKFFVRKAFASAAQAFVEKGKLLASRREPSATSVPFNCYWPTYIQLDVLQERWYFYWRGEVREGRYPDTHLSYIFIHVYELINNIGVTSPLDGYEQLRKLWLAYRTRHPKLDRYLIDWISDYISLNNCPINFLEFLTEAIELGCPISDPDLVLPRYITGPLEKLPKSLVAPYIDYRVLDSKFCLAGHRELVDKYFSKTIAHVNTCLLSQNGKGIFELFKPEITHPARQRAPFLSAVFLNEGQVIQIPARIPYSGHQPLREFLTAILKCVENRLRVITNFKGKVTELQLPKDTRKVIEDFIDGFAAEINPPPPKPVIKIDFSKACQLAKESAEIREMLSTPDDIVSQNGHRDCMQFGGSAGGEGPMLSASSHAGRPPRHAMSDSFRIRPLSAEKPDQSEAGDEVGQDSCLPNAWENFRSKLSGDHLLILQAILSGSDVLIKLKRICDPKALMPEVIIDQLNEVAMDNVGDLIIVPGSTCPMIEEGSIDLVAEIVRFWETTK